MFPPHNPYCSLLNSVSLLNGCKLELSNNKEPEVGQIVCNACCSNDKKLDYWLAGLKLEVRGLRKKLKGSFAHINYTDRYIRAAYMFAYFPFYIEPIYEVIIYHTEKIILSNPKELNVSFIGGGPLPELLGLSKAISEKRKDIEKINAYVLDAVPHWSSERKQCTKELLKFYFEKKSSIFSLKYDFFSNEEDVPSIIKKCDLVLVQNCINDCPKGSIANIEKNIQKNWLSMRKSSIIILLDLNYTSINELMKRLQKFFSHNSGSVIQPISSIKNYRPNIPFCEHLETKLYELGVDGLISRRKVNYYSLMALKD